MNNMRNKKGQFIKGHKVPKKWRDVVSRHLSGKPILKSKEWLENNRQSILEGYKKGRKCWSKGKKRPNLSLRMKELYKSGKLKPVKMMGSNNPGWKGGVTPKHKLIRESKKYKDWRESVFIRDNYTCQMCKKRGGRLQVDHIKPFSRFPELRFKLSNGRVLCIDCHKKTETWGGGSSKKPLFYENWDIKS